METNPMIDMLQTFFKPYLFLQLITASFLAVLFLQSGLDKVFDWKGNLSWLKGHFAKSPFKNMVPLLLGVIALFELAAGVSSAVGVVSLLLGNSSRMALLGAELSALSLLMLFIGQRLAKDYAGAATLASYFVLALLSILILS